VGTRGTRSQRLVLLAEARFDFRYQLAQFLDRKKGCESMGDELLQVVKFGFTPTLISSLFVQHRSASGSDKKRCVRENTSDPTLSLPAFDALLKARQRQFGMAPQTFIGTTYCVRRLVGYANNYHSHLTIRTARPLGRAPFLRRILHWVSQTNDCSF
jgi:hypothetical protein